MSIFRNFVTTYVYSLELNPKAKEEQEAKRRQILDSFRNAPFEDIVARSEAKVRMIILVCGQTGWVVQDTLFLIGKRP